MVEHMPFIFASYTWLDNWWNGGTAWLAMLSVLMFFVRRFNNASD